MAIPKVCGIETEYGVVAARRGRPQPGAGVVDADQRLRRAPPGRLGLRGRVARAATPAASPARARMPPEIETHLVNTVLTNGARYYVDHAHPEYSTPECSDALELVVRRQGGGADPRPVDARGPPARSSPGQEIVVYKNNSDGKGNSLRHARELPRRPGGAVRAARAQPAAVVREPPGVHRRGQGRHRERRRRRSTTRSASAPTSSRRRSGSRPR